MPFLKTATCEPGLSSHLTSFPGMSTLLMFHATLFFALGAKIRIDRDNEDMSSSLRKCTVTGTSDQIASAKGLLDEKIAEDNEIRARRGDVGMPRNSRAPRKLDTVLGEYSSTTLTSNVLFNLVLLSLEVDNLQLYMHHMYISQ